MPLLRGVRAQRGGQGPVGDGLALDSVMDAVVIYESMFGDNQQVALAIVEGLTSGGVQARAVEVGIAPTAISGDVDLLVVGSPNHGWSMPRPGTREDAAGKTDAPLVSQGIGVREWLATATVDAGIRTTAYDTRGSHPKAVVAFDHRLHPDREGPGHARGVAGGAGRAFPCRRRDRPPRTR